MSTPYRRLVIAGGLMAALAACASEPPAPAADLLLVNARVYTMTWPDPATDGTPDASAPHDQDGWHPDAVASPS